MPDAGPCAEAGLGWYNINSASVGERLGACVATIYDYLRWRGDLSFGERPFNDVDNIVLATLAYLDLRGIVPAEGEDEPMRLGDACELLLAQSKDDIAPYVRSLANIKTRFVELLVQSPRFSSIGLSDYVDIVDKRRSLQFSALSARLTDDETYVAFRGTDSSIVGWREDVMLSFAITEAQHEAARYLERAMQHTSGRVYVGGHSKGGMLAEYAMTQCPEPLRSRIARVYSNDGPGMAPEVVGECGEEDLSGRIRRIVPSYSVVGMLFSRPGDPRAIVASSNRGIEQHDPTSWQVTRSGLEQVGELQPDCVALNEAIASWIEKLPLDKRKLVTNQIFDALEAGGAQQIDEILGSAESFHRVMQALAKTDDLARDVALSLVQTLLDSSVGSVRKAARRTMAKFLPPAREPDKSRA
jgi:pimeloyl-ACP methyl ester carboxylesterase